jgi:hypothetical protein
MQPNEYRIERSTLTTANPGAVYTIMCDLDRFRDWSPFTKLDPNAKIVVEGPRCAPGSVYTWEGNDEAGAGKMTIVNATPGQSVDVRIESFKPMPSVALTTWAVAPEGGQNRITWTMSGESDALSAKIIRMLFVEKMLGSMFDEGLATLKKLAEASSF